MKQKLIVSILCLGILVLATGCINQNQYNGGNNTTYVNQPPRYGNIAVVVTDAAAEMESVSHIDVTINSVQAKKQSGEWVTLSSEARTYDLIELRDSDRERLYTNTRTTSGSYSQMRIYISQVSVVDSNGTRYPCRVPNNEMTISGDFSVDGDETTVVEFDFKADQSLHKTSSGYFVIAPVVEIESRDDATINSYGGDWVTVSGGSVQHSSTVGMRLDGTLGFGNQIASNAVININGNGGISLG